MDYIKTKEAAHILGVSQTTIKRWASATADRFHKDTSGHYVFTSDDLEALAGIKHAIDNGRKAIQEQAVTSTIEAPTNLAVGNEKEADPYEAGPPNEQEYDFTQSASTAVIRLGKSSGQTHQPHGNETTIQPLRIEELNSRLNTLEYMLTRKAGDVVTFQILEHRRELDELRLSLRQLFTTLDAITVTLAEIQAKVPPSQGERLPQRSRTRIGSWL